MLAYLITKKSETDAATVHLGSDGIMRVIFKRKKEVNKEAFEELFKVFNELSDGRAYAYIYSAEDTSVTVSEDGRRYAKEQEFSFPKVCNAVIVTNLAHKLLANFYLRFNKPSYPFRVFSKTEDAEKWCLAQLAKKY